MEPDFGDVEKGRC